MTNLDSILKSRDTTLLMTKMHMVKAMVFPVVMSRYESWTIKKAQSVSQSVSSVAQSCLTLRPHESQHPRPLCPAPIPGVHPDSHPSSQWCHPTILFSVVPFSSCFWSFPASGSLPVSRFFTSCGQSIGVSASVSVLPMNIQDWFPLGLTGWISLQSKSWNALYIVCNLSLGTTSFGRHCYCPAQ